MSNPSAPGGAGVQGPSTGTAGGACLALAAAVPDAVSQEEGEQPTGALGQCMAP